MAVYRCPSSDPFRNNSAFYGDAPGMRAALAQQRAAYERAFRDLQERAAMARERDGIIDLVCVDGVWQVPSL